MRQVVIAILILNTSFLFGQSKRDMIGQFRHSSFMYSYTLTLKDNESYETVESSDLGSEITSGTWTILGQAIRLAPKRKITTDIQTKQKKETPIENKELVVVIETKNNLTFKKPTGDLKLERVQ